MGFTEQVHSFKCSFAVRKEVLYLLRELWEEGYIAPKIYGISEGIDLVFTRGEKKTVYRVWMGGWSLGDKTGESWAEGRSYLKDDLK